MTNRAASLQRAEAPSGGDALLDELARLWASASPDHRKRAKELFTQWLHYAAEARASEPFRELLARATFRKFPAELAR